MYLCIICFTRSPCAQSALTTKICFQSRSSLPSRSTAFAAVQTQLSIGRPFLKFKTFFRLIACYCSLARTTSLPLQCQQSIQGMQNVRFPKPLHLKPKMIPIRTLSYLLLLGCCNQMFGPLRYQPMPTTWAASTTSISAYSLERALELNTNGARHSPCKYTK